MLICAEGGEKKSLKKSGGGSGLYLFTIFREGGVWKREETGVSDRPAAHVWNYVGILFFITKKLLLSDRE